MYITLILHMNIIINKYVFASLDFTHMVCDKKYLESIVVWGVWGSEYRTFSCVFGGINSPGYFWQNPLHALRVKHRWDRNSVLFTSTLAWPGAGLLGSTHIAIGTSHCKTVPKTSICTSCFSPHDDDFGLFSLNRREIKWNNSEERGTGLLWIMGRKRYS